MKIKVRVWGGRPTLATEQGKKVDSPEALEKWIAQQVDGRIEVWAGRWWVVSVESAPFTVESGKCHCTHPKYRSKKGLDTRDYPGFFAHEAWRIASKTSSMWAGIGEVADGAAKAARDKNYDLYPRRT